MARESKTSIRKNSTKLILSVILLMLLNYVLHSYIQDKTDFHLSKLLAFETEFQIGLARTIFIGIPLLGFILGLFASFIPFKKLSYKQKYINTALILTLILQTIYVILGLAGQIIN